MPIEDAEGEEGETLPREFADWRPDPEEQYKQAEGIEQILQKAAHSLSPASVQSFSCAMWRNFQLRRRRNFWA